MDILITQEIYGDIERRKERVLLILEKFEEKKEVIVKSNKKEYTEEYIE